MDTAVSFHSNKWHTGQLEGAQAPGDHRVTEGLISAPEAGAAMTTLNLLQDLDSWKPITSMLTCFCVKDLIRSL